MTKLLPLLAIMALLLALVSLASAQEATTDTSSDPDLTADPPVALQQNGLVKLADNTDEVDDEADGLVVGFVAGDPGATPPSAASYRSYAVSLTTGSDAGWYQLVEVLIATKVTGTPLARLSIHRDHEGSPHAEALYVTHFRGASEEDPDLYLEFPDNTPLYPNQTYWAVFEEVSGLGVYEISTAPNGDENPDSWPISDTSLQRNFFSLTGRTWQASALNPIAMVVDGYPVEERVLVGAHGLRDTADDGPLLRFGTERITKVWLKLPMGQTFDFCEPAFVAGSGTERSWRLCDLHRDSHYDHEWAGGRGFTTGPNPTGYTISGLGVDIDAQSGTLDPVANIYAAEAFSSRKGARDPQSPLASYQATAGIGGSPDRFAPRTAVSEKLHVEPGRTYVAYFQNAAAGYYQTPNARAGQDAGAEDGWTLGYPYGSKFIHPLGFAGDSWNFRPGDSKRIPLNIHGWPNPLPAAPNPAPPPPGPVLVSTLGQPSNPTSQLVGKRINLEIGYAASFTNGNDAVHALHGVQIEVTVIPPLQVLGAIRASIYSDGGGEPGVALYELGLRANPQVGVLTFDAPADTTLAANTTFWLVIDIAHSPTEDFFRTAVTSGTGQDACAIRDWSIGDVAYFREGPGAAWSPNADLLKMAILGEPASSASAELGEPACDDLPGDTTTTGRLVVDGDGVKGQHASARDADWYAVSLDAGVDYQFDVVDAPPVYLLKIHDDQGTELRTSAIAPVGDTPYYQHPNRVNSLPFRTDQADTYYVSIASPKGGHAPDRVYTLSAQSDDHPADTTTTAVAELGELTRVYLMRTSSDPDDTATSDVDWVRASLLANVRYHISFDVGKCPQTAVIEGIHDADGTAIPMTSSSKACSASLYFTPTTKADYYIAVTGKGSQFVDQDDVDDDGRLKGTYHDRYPFIGADAVLVVSLVVNYCTGESLDTLGDALTPLSEPAGGDLPAGTSAAGRAPIGSSVTGNIESATDRDWFRVRFNGRIGERVYWLELKGADTGDGTLPDPLIVGIYDRQGNYIPFSHIVGQSKTRDNDSGYGRNAITDFTAPCAGDYFVAVAGFEGSTGAYTLSVTDITDTSTSIPIESVGETWFVEWGLDTAEEGNDVDYLIGNLAPGLPATVPAHDPRNSEPTELYDTNQRGNAGASALFRLGVVPDRDYRLEIRVPETTDGRPANVGFIVFRGYLPYFDLGDVDEGQRSFLFNFWLVNDQRNGDVSIEFKAPRFYEARGRTLPSRLLVGFELGEYHFEPGDVYTFVLTDITDSEDDYLGAEETTGTVAVGGSVTGNLEVDNDVDWFKVRLEEGKSYRVRMRGAESGGGTLADPFLSIGHGGSFQLTDYGFGRPVLRNDDKSESEKDSELVLSVTRTHDTWISAATSGTGTGTYTIEVEEVTPSMGQRANSPATGGPGITGTVQAGETLTATTDGIEDEDGLTGTVFAYQWVRSDTDIEGAASSNYTVTGADEGKPIQVRVTFTDDAGNAESLTSYAKLSAPPLIIPDSETPPESTETREAREAQGAQEAAESPLTAAIHDAPESHDGQEDFTFELRFSENLEGFSYKTMRDNAFTVTGGNVEGARRLDPPSNTKWQIKIRPTSNGDVTIVLPITEDCTADGAVCTGDRKLSNRLEIIVSGPTSQQTSQQRQESTAATGSPTISGTVQVGQTLAASTTGIADTDGLTNAAYSYQWIANDGSSDSDIADATASAYTLVARDAGKTIKVKVSFTDDGGNEETLTSAVTAAVAATVPDAPGSLSVSVNDTGRLDVSWGAPESNGGSSVTGYRVQWKEAPDSWDTPADVSETTVTGTGHTVTGLTDGVEYTFRVFAVNTVGDSSATDDESGTSRETTAPTLSSATVDGATLTLTFSEGLTETPLPAVATFTVNVEGNQRGVNTVAISGSTVTLTLASAVTSTDDVSVGYTVPSDAAAARLKDLSDNPAESFTGQTVTNNTAAAPPPLTASIHDEPSSHDGQKEFTFELRFSENLEGFSYKTMRDNAFTVTGGNVEGARRLDPPSNTKWQIKIRPTSNGDVTIVLPITEDCTADGAVCTGDRKLSNRLEIIVSGPNG